MNLSRFAILEQLRKVDSLRAERRADVALGQRVMAVKCYQQERFKRTYADLLASDRYADAARFFLEELYGPRDFAQRDDQFARIVPALVRLFPHQIVDTVTALAALHALSEALDNEMARQVDELPLTRVGYANAWQRTGRPEERERQIELTLEVGRALDRYTRNMLVRHSLHLMRAPARAAGMSELQSFLERGFDTFARMRGASQFLGTVGLRERALAKALFATESPDTKGGAGDPLEQLP